VLRARSGHAAGANLAAVRDELAKQLDVLVVDPVALVATELTDLALLPATEAAFSFRVATGAAALAVSISVSWHVRFLRLYDRVGLGGATRP
jgi:hypothetical protein